MPLHQPPDSEKQSQGSLHATGVDGADNAGRYRTITLRGRACGYAKKLEHVIKNVMVQGSKHELIHVM